MPPKPPDENDRKQAGTFSGDPFDGIRPLSSLATSGDGGRLSVDLAPPAQLTRAELRAALERSDRRHRKIERPIPIPWDDLAEQLGGGLWPGMHVLVAGTGTGKTTLALQIAVEAANAGYPVCYAGLELDAMQIALRILGTRARLPWSKFYTGQADSEAQWQSRLERAHEAVDELPDEWPFFCEYGDPSGWAPSRLGQIARALRARYPHPEGRPGSLPMLLVLDFLQIVGDDVSSDGRPVRSDLRERIGRAAYQARAVAREQDAAVLVVSSTARDRYGLLGDLDAAGIGVELDGAGQVSRRVLLNRDALLGTGKESGEIEYAADTVTVALRWPGKVPESEHREGETAVVLASPKVRHGGESWSELRFNGWSFQEPAPELSGHVAYAISERQKQKSEEKQRRMDEKAARSGAALPHDPKETDHGDLSTRLE